MRIAAGCEFRCIPIDNSLKLSNQTDDEECFDNDDIVLSCLELTQRIIR